MTDYTHAERARRVAEPAAEVDPTTRTVRVTTAHGIVTLTYSGRANRWTWTATAGPVGVSARMAAQLISDLVPDAPTLLRAAVAGLTPAAQAMALEGL
jgi:hypothetical protein